MTTGYDAQRSFWVRGDPKISIETMRKPGFQLVWKVKLNNQARQLNSLTPPALIDFYIGYRGFRTLGFFGGSANTAIGIDTDLGRIEWEKTIAPASPAPAGSLPCPGGMTSSVTRPTNPGYPAAFSARGFGRSGPAKSGVGEPLQGAVTLREQPSPPPAPPPPVAAAGRRVAPPPNPFARGPQFVHAVTADGKFHSMYVSNGEEPNPPVAFLPADAHAQGLIVFDNTAYVATINGCGDAGNGVWALNLQSQKVTHWKANANIAGSAGPAAGPDGTLYVATTSGELVALDPVSLTMRSSYKSSKGFASSPAVFEYKARDLVAVAASDGQLHLLDTAALSGPPLATTPASPAAELAAGALASWQDTAGTRWVLAPAASAIMAWKVVDKSGVPAFESGWTSRDLVSPLTPIIVNGVVFALSSGEFRTNDSRVTAAQRAQRSSRAVLYALDPATGKELWNSGSAITSFVHSGGLSAGGGRVYAGSYDSTQYAFSFPMEH
jgi:outer membrane protein assembly factor BamB